MGYVLAFLGFGPTGAAKTGRAADFALSFGDGVSLQTLRSLSGPCPNHRLHLGFDELRLCPHLREHGGLSVAGMVDL